MNAMVLVVVVAKKMRVGRVELLNVALHLNGAYAFCDVFYLY
jgi:hypothetical protein